MKKFPISYIFCAVFLFFNFAIQSEILATDLHYGDQIQFRSVRFGNYLSARDGGNHSAVKLMTEALGYETFTILDSNGKPSGKVVKKQDHSYLKSNRWNNYLSARDSGDHEKIELMASPGGYEKFNFEGGPTGDKVQSGCGWNIRSVRWGNYISARDAGNNAGVELMKNASGYENFEIVILNNPNNKNIDKSKLYYGDKIFIRSARFGNLLSARGRKHAAAELMRIDGGYEEWQALKPGDRAFRGAVNYGNTVIFYSLRHDSYLSGRGGGDHDGVETMDEIGSYEMWTLKNALKPADSGQVDFANPVFIFNDRHSSWLSARGEDLHAKVEMMQKAAGYETWYLATTDYLKNWMFLNKSLRDKPLKDICFPGSHDCGTWDLSDEYTASADESLKMMKTRFGEKAHKAAADATRGLAKTTTVNIQHQLNLGVRALDVRVYFPLNKPPCIHHTLLGPEISEILDQVSTFCKSTQGEIILLWMSHFESEPYENGGSLQLRKMILDKLGPYLFKPGNKPAMECKFSEVVGNKGSKVILIMESDLSYPKDFWKPSQLLKDGGNFEMPYANEATVERMTRVLKPDYLEKSTKEEPLQLYITLTPQDEHCDRIVRTALEKVVGIAALGDKTRWTADWSTVEALSKPIWSNFNEVVKGVRNGSASDPGRVTILWADFPEYLPFAHWALERSLAQ